MRLLRVRCCACLLFIVADELRRGRSGSVRLYRGERLFRSRLLNGSGRRIRLQFNWCSKSETLADACKRGDTALVNTLLGHGVSPDTLDKVAQ
mgnify:CR=1 FL=1